MSACVKPSSYADAFKIQSHLVYFDTSHNSVPTMLRNIHNAFSETAAKMWAYARCLPKNKQPGTPLLKGKSPCSSFFVQEVVSLQYCAD